jgi:hypothetical protein
MDFNSLIGVAHHTRAAIIISAVVVSTWICLAQPVPSGPIYSVADSGPFYNVLQRTVSVTNIATGEVSPQVQSYTELGDGLNYMSNGQWVAAQDLIEVTPTGAQATHGQMTATFDSDITSVAAISLATATETFQSHPIGLFYFDSSSGRLAQLGSVQSSVGTLEVIGNSGAFC